MVCDHFTFLSSFLALLVIHFRFVYLETLFEGDIIRLPMRGVS